MLRYGDDGDDGRGSKKEHVHGCFVENDGNDDDDQILPAEHNHHKAQHTIITKHNTQSSQNTTRSLSQIDDGREVSFPLIGGITLQPNSNFPPLQSECASNNATCRLLPLSIMDRFKHDDGITSPSTNNSASARSLKFAGHFQSWKNELGVTTTSSIEELFHNNNIRSYHYLEPVTRPPTEQQVVNDLNKKGTPCQKQKHLQQ